MDRKEKYHFTGLRAELISVGTLNTPTPEHKSITGVVRLIGGRPGVDRMPIVAFNKMADAMADKMRVGCTYDFSGYMLGDGETTEPRMRLHVCWSDRVPKDLPDAKVDPAVN